MKNYISVNLKHYKKKEIDRIARHNSRVEKINYLLKKEHIEYENVNIFYANDLINKEGHLLTKVGEYSPNQKNLFSKKDLDLNMRRQYNLLINKKEAIQKQNKSYTKDNESTLIEMVVALSEEQAKAYLKDGKDLGIGFDRFALNLQKKHGFTPLQTSIHLDEGYVDENGIVKNNIHAHLTFVNFHFDKQKVCLRNLKKQDYKDLQDLAANSFQEVGFDFIRGIDKEITKREHLEQNDFAISQQLQKIKQLDFEYKNIVAIVNNAKKEEQELLKNYEKLTQDYKEVYKNVGELRELEKTLRKIDFKSFNDESKLALNDIFKNNINGNKIEDKEQFVKQITSFVKNIHKVQFTNIKEQDRKIVELEQKLKDKEEQNNTLLEKLNLERNKNKDLEQNKGQIVAQNQKLIQTMDKQQKALIRQTRRNTRLRNQRRLLLQKIIRDNNLKSVMQTRNFLRNSKNRVLNKKQVVVFNILCQHQISPKILS